MLIFHGSYKRYQYLYKAAGVKPHLVSMFPIWLETWCHTLTKLWSCGVSVIGFDTGAIGESITQTGAGWALNDMQAESVECCLKSLSQEAVWDEAYCNVLTWQKGTGKEQIVQNMGQKYLKLYNSLIKLN